VVGGPRCRHVCRAVVVAGVLGLGATACSSSPAGESGASTSSSTTLPATTTTQDVAADRALAHEALLTTAEVPGGPWTEGDARPDQASEGFDCPELADEARFFDEHARDAPDAKGPDLESAGVTLQLDVNIVATEEVADRVSGFVGDPRFATCLTGRFEDEAADDSRGVTLNDISVEPADLAPLGDATAAWAISFELAQGSQVATVSGVYVMVQVGRGFTLVSLIGEQPFTSSDVRPIASAATEKLAATLGG
jgi:hypothetical protein